MLAPATGEASTHYNVTVESGTFTALSAAEGPVTNLTIRGTSYDGEGNVALPFPVRFFGVEYDEVSMSTNGYLTFGPFATSLNSSSNHYSRSQTPHALGSGSAIPNQLLAVWWKNYVCDDAPDRMRVQTRGETPNRIHIAEYNGCRRYGSIGTPEQFYAQVWFFEGSSTIQVKYGSFNGADSGVAMGIEDPSGTIAFTPGCNADCSQFPTNQVITYSQGPDLAVAALTGETIGYAGVTTHLSANIRNNGAQVAEAELLRVRFLVSQDATLSDDDLLIGEVELEDFVLGAGATHTVDLSAPLPARVTPGSWFLLAQVDPDGAVEDGAPANNVNYFGPIVVGEAAPDLRVVSVTRPTGATPGGVVDIEWVVENTGNLVAIDADFAVALSRNNFLSSVDPRVYFGSITVEAGATETVQVQVELPADLEPGPYWIGVEIDPNGDLHELDKSNNTRLSTNSFQVVGTGLVILDRELPRAELSSPYCPALRAGGGTGVYEWTLQSGTLPPGLELVVERAGTTPVATLLCGTPSARGSYDFTLRVESGSESATQTYQLDVGNNAHPLVITTTGLSLARFQAPYSEALLAVGGTPPYTWSLAEGALPAGVALTRSGMLLGNPAVDGTWPIVVEAVDAVGNRAAASLVFEVAPPARLTCVTRSLPTAVAGSRYDVELVGAGGTKPYTWETRDFRRLPNGSTDPGRVYGQSLPEGLDLVHAEATGITTVTGTVPAAGRYVWELYLRDSDADSTECALAFDVTFEQGLAVTTLALQDVVVDTPVEVALAATGGEGTLRWSLAAGSNLPDGLELSEDGVIAGTVGRYVLGSDSSRSYTFLVEVRDGDNRFDVVSLSLRVLAAAPRSPRAPAADGGGCQAGMGDPSLLALGAALGLAALRRRRS